MRHTGISEWLGQGIDIGRVAKAVGTSVKMIELHYQQFIKSDFVEKLTLFNGVSATSGSSQVAIRTPPRQINALACQTYIRQYSTDFS
jgi:hypothetical protein